MPNTNSSHLIRSAAILALMIGAGAAKAAAPRSFSDIEYSMSGQELTVAEQALADRLAPHGASVTDAATALRHAGVRQLRPATNGDLRFVYAASDFANDMQQDVRIVIRVSQSGGQVGSASVSRKTYGG